MPRRVPDARETSPCLREEGFARDRRKADGVQRSRVEGASEHAPRPAPPSRPVAPPPDRSAQAEPGEQFVRVGEFGRAHGLKGEVRLKSATAEPDAIASYGPLRGGDGRVYRISTARSVPGSAPDLLIARVEGIDSRESAEALNRLPLFADRAHLPPPEDDDEFLAADLVGLAVEDTGRRALGTVIGAVDYGAGDLLEIRRERGGSVLLPFTKAFVPAIDLAGRRLVADPPTGIFDDADEVRTGEEGGK